jgi:hypothetical protein
MKKMSGKGITFEDVVNQDATGLMLLIDEQIQWAIPEVDLVIAIEEIEIASLQFFPKFYHDVLSVAWASALKQLAHGSISSQSFTYIEDIVGKSLSFTGLILALSKLFLELPWGFEAQILAIIASIYTCSIVWRKKLDRQVRICKDRLNIVGYLMERNLS